MCEFITICMGVEGTNAYLTSTKMPRCIAHDLGATSVTPLYTQDTDTHQNIELTMVNLAALKLATGNC
jgi:hypothetical protein